MTAFNEVKDSGVREDMPTGSRRDSRDGKGRFDCLPPQVLKRDAKHYENGANKYGDNNYLLGQKTSRYLDSALRHLNAYRLGDRCEDHLAAARWNIAGVMLNEELVAEGVYPEELHDIPVWDAMRAECAANGRPYTQQELRRLLRVPDDNGEPRGGVKHCMTIDPDAHYRVGTGEAVKVNCGTCTFEDAPGTLEPCCDCTAYDKWEAK